jgi:hypothetical protein
MANSMSIPVNDTVVDISTKQISHLNIQVKNYSVADHNYVILNADKTFLCDDDKIRRKYNTVIINPETNKILSIGSPISTPIDYFDSECDDICASELVEGSMIYLFYEERNNAWQIATSNAVGGNYSYFRNHDPSDTTTTTFLKMVMDAFRETAVGDSTEQLTINSISFLRDFDKKYCYGFVLQHPINSMVHPIDIPKLFLVSVVELHDNNTKNSVCYVPRHEYESWPCFQNLKDGIIYFPKLYSADKAVEYYQNMFSNLQTPKEIMGISIVDNASGIRSEIINPNYKEAKEIRGNNFNLQFHYLCLLKINNVHVFLKHFPHYKQLFTTYKDQLNRFITNLHQVYFHYYISKKLKRPIHKKYYYHIHQIHRTIYIPSIEKGKKTIIKRSVVASYVESLQPGQILHMINFEKTAVSGTMTSHHTECINPSTI